MSRMIAVLILVIVAWALVSRAMKRLGSSPLGQLLTALLGGPTHSGPSRRSPGEAVTLVACESCGVHVPSDRATAGAQGAGYLCATCSQSSSK